MSSWLSYAEWCASRGLNERAEALLRKGLNRLPDAAALHHAISSIFEAQGYREIALKALKKAVSLAPDRVDFGDELARLEFFSGFAEAAIGRWETLRFGHQRIRKSPVISPSPIKPSDTLRNRSL